MGERTPVAVNSAAASARLAVGESLTNLAAAQIGDLGKVNLSANWMSAPALPGDEALRALRDENARLRDAHCTRLRDAWVTLESGVRLARTLHNGEREVLDDAARAAERQRLQGLLASDCPTL